MIKQVERKKYKVYELLCDYTYTYKNVFGTVKQNTHYKGSFAYEGISYDGDSRNHYFNRRPACGGEFVAKTVDVENNQEIFKFKTFIYV